MAALFFTDAGTCAKEWSETSDDTTIT